MMDLREKRIDGTTVLTAKWGTGVLRWDHGVLSRMVRILVARGDKRIVFDVADLPHFDSEGITELIQCLTIASRHGAELKLRNVHGKMKELLEAAHLLPLLSEEESRAG